MQFPSSSVCVFRPLCAPGSRGKRLLAWLLLSIASVPAWALNLRYDSDGSDTNGITDGTASAWNTTATNKPWYDSVAGTYSAWVNSNANVAVFGGGSSGTAGGITVGTVTANGIIFDTASAGSYTLNSGTITLDGTTPTITVNAATASINSKLTTASLIKNGTGTLVLSNSGNNVGHLTVEAGKVDLFSVVASNNVVVNGSAGFITHSGNTWTMDSLVYNTTTGSSFYAGNNHSNYTIGAGGLTLSGTGTLAIAADANTNTPVSKLTLQGDILVTENNAISASGTGTASQRLLDFAGGIRTVTVATGKLFSIRVITQNGGLVKDGAGTLELQAANTYAGNTTVNAGTLRLSGSGTLGAVTNDLVLAAGATLDLGGTTQTVDILDGAGTVTNSSTTTGTLILGSDNGTGIFSGLISGSAANKVAIVKNGTGTQTFTGANTYSGGTVLNAGILAAVDSTVYGSTGQIKKAFGTGPITLNGGTLQLRANGNGTTTAETLTYGNEVIVGGDVTLDAARESGTGTAKTLKFGNLTMGASTLTVKAPNSYSVDFTASTLTGNGVFDVQSGTLNFANGLAAGSNSITKRGAGILTIRGGTHGDLLVEAGVADIYNTAVSRNVTVNGTGRLDTHSGTVWSMDSLTYNSTANSAFNGYSANGTYNIGSLTLTSNATLSIVATNVGTTSKVVLKGNAVITGNSSLVKSTAPTNLGNMLFDLDGGVRSFEVATGKTFTVGVTTQNGGVTKTGDGTLLFTVANTYAGNTTVNAGTVRLSATGSIDTSARISVAPGAFYDVSAVVGYSVKNGQRLEGGGTVTGSISIANGALLAPGILGGNEVQTLTINGALSLASGSQTFLDLSTLGSSDRLNITGSFTQNNGAQIVVLPGSFIAAGGQSFNLLDWGSLVSLSSNLGPLLRDGSEDDALDLNLPSLVGTGLMWDVSQFATSGIISIVPEPSRMLLVLLAGAAVLMRRRRTSAC